MTTDELSAFADNLWRANKGNSANIAKDAFNRFPLPPMFANLETLSGGQFSKLLGDLQKRAFLLGVLAVFYASEPDPLKTDTQ